MKIKTIIVTSMTVFALLVGTFLGITSLVSAQGAEPSVSAHGRGGENLESVAEILGIPVEDLQETLQNSRPVECADLERGEKPEDVDCRPDLETAATALGITVEELESAFETAREQVRAERLKSVAEELGVTVEELQTALENARPAECTDLEPGERPADGINCRADLEQAAETLGVDVEELQTALQNERGGRRGPGHHGPNGDGEQP